MTGVVNLAVRLPRHLAHEIELSRKLRKVPISRDAWIEEAARRYLDELKEGDR